MSCGEFIYRGRKFNARKESPDERYLGVPIYRFYIRCTRCSGEITFKTDPKNLDYACERGAKRTTEPWRRGGSGDREETDEERLDRLEREAGGDGAEEERNAMAELEAKTADARREMAVADALDEIRMRNARLERADREGAEVALQPRPEDEERLRQEREDEEAARRAFAFARGQEEMWEAVSEEEGDDGASASSAANSNSSVSVATSAVTSAPTTATPISTDMPPPSFKRQVKKKKDHAALLGIKKKPALV